MAAAADEGVPESRGFWNHRYFLAALSIIGIVPLIWPDVPPLADLPGHIGRYRIQLDLETSPFLRRFYDFEWSIIGNLGVDLLVVPLEKLLGLEPAVKLIVLAIPALTIAGFLWLAREVHGHIPPSALFALPFAYSQPFIFGFVNFSLSMALAFLALALWIRLGRLGQLRIRTALFVPLSMAVWLCHASGWGMLGLLAFCAEAARLREEGRGFAASSLRAAIQCLALAPPVLLMLVWRSGGEVQGGTGGWFDWDFKLVWMLTALHDRWQAFDTGALALSLLVLAAGIRSKRFGFAPSLTSSAFLLLAVYLLLPRVIFGSGYADMRLAPYIIAIALLAMRPLPYATSRQLQLVAAAGLAFFLVRIGGHTASFWVYDRIYDRELAALEHVPRGARVLSLVAEPCGRPWAMSRLQHIGGLAVARREAFSNEQWVVEGAQLSRARNPQAGEFQHDPSQIVMRGDCPGETHPPVSAALARVPRAAFDYVWLITAPEVDPRLTQGMRPVWRSGTSSLYRIEH